MYLWYNEKLWENANNYDFVSINREFQFLRMAKINRLKKLGEKCQLKYFKSLQNYSHSRCFKQNVPTSRVKGDQTLTYKMSIH